MSDDLPPPRRPLFFPVVIATTFLSIIGMSAGLLLGAQRDRDETNLNSGTAIPTPVVEPSPDDPPTPEVSGRKCRSETQAAAELVGVAGTLVQVLRLRTETSEVYICRDQAGSLYYHANNGGDSWVENETALFLPNVQHGETDYHVAAPDGATFSVTKERLRIVHADGRVETQKRAG